MDQQVSTRWPAARGAQAGTVLARTVLARTVLAGTALAAAAGLAACASGPSGGAGHPAADGTTRASAPAAAASASAGVPLCVDARRVDQVLVRLTGSQPRAMLPREHTVTGAARVQALATALCGLPPAARGRGCPPPRPGSLLLLFTAGGRGYRPVRIQDSGCASVLGVGPARRWAWSARPGRLLSNAVGGSGRLIPDTHPSSVPTE